MKLPVVIPSLAAVKFWVQTPLGVSEWVPVDQERIDRFADATEDRQWIHVDVERARRESPWKQTIAHGYLTLSLIPAAALAPGRDPRRRRRRSTPASTSCASRRPCSSGSRVRLHAEIKDAREVPASALRITFAVRVEVEGGEQARPDRERQLPLLPGLSRVARVLTGPGGAPMLRGMRVALAQVNPTVGDLRGNRRLVEEAAAKAASEKADLVVLPEMVLTGYPPMDLLEREGFVRDQLRELDALAPASARVAIALGAVLPADGAGARSGWSTPRCCSPAARAARCAPRRCSRPTTSSTRSAGSSPPRGARR